MSQSTNRGSIAATLARRVADIHALTNVEAPASAAPFHEGIWRKVHECDLIEEHAALLNGHFAQIQFWKAWADPGSCVHALIYNSRWHGMFPDLETAKRAAELAAADLEGGATEAGWRLSADKRALQRVVGGSMCTVSRDPEEDSASPWESCVIGGPGMHAYFSSRELAMEMAVRTATAGQVA